MFIEKLDVRIFRKGKTIWSGQLGQIPRKGDFIVINQETLNNEYEKQYLVQKVLWLIMKTDSPKIAIFID